MGLSLIQTQAISDLAAHLYSYLPGSSAWRGTYTFESAAQEHQLGEFWIGGSKLPALTHLLEATLVSRSSAFCSLIETIVREGLKYRKRQGPPINKADLAELNQLVAAVGFKIPSLWDPAFGERLPDGPPAETPAGDIEQLPSVGAERAGQRRRALAALRDRFLELGQWSDRQAAGRSLERLLTDLFQEFELRRRGSFLVPGEQIDGSIVLDGSHYLVEAKWEASPIGLAPLMVFREKVASKSSMTRGVFISVSGYDAGAQVGITTGKQPNFLMLNGLHLYAVLDGQKDLVDLLPALLREPADTGRPFVPLAEVPD